jgi:hypothetical protein
MKTRFFMVWLVLVLAGGFAKSRLSYSAGAGLPNVQLQQSAGPVGGISSTTATGGISSFALGFHFGVFTGDTWGFLFDFGFLIPMSMSGSYSMTGGLSAAGSDTVWDWTGVKWRHDIDLIIGVGHQIKLARKMRLVLGGGFHMNKMLIVYNDVYLMGQAGVGVAAKLYVNLVNNLSLTVGTDLGFDFVNIVSSPIYLGEIYQPTVCPNVHIGIATSM